MICYVDTGEESTRLVNEILPNVAKAVFKGVVITYAQVAEWGDTRSQFGVSHQEVPAITFYQPRGGKVPYPEDDPIEEEDLIGFATQVLIGEIEAVETTLGEVTNEKLVKKVEKYIGELVTADSYEHEIRTEGYDTVLLAFSSASASEHQENVVSAFIDCKTRFKRMRNRSVRFYSIDMNREYMTNLGTSAASIPFIVMYPSFHKDQAHRYTQNIDAISLANFIQKTADISFVLKELYFRKEDQDQSL